MNKTELLDRCARSGEERVLLARVLDKLELSQNRGVPAHTPFLSPGEQASVGELLNAWGRPRCIWTGGYEGAERQACLFLPDWQEPEDALADPEGPLAALEALFPRDASLSHRDILGGLMGFNFYQKTAGIVGTGKIGAAMARICHGFGMKVIGYDMYPNKDLDFVEYVDLDTLLSQSDLISLHCPLMEETHHMINIDTIQKMKDGVILVNTSRGGLIKTDDLIQGIRENKFFAVGLDVYEEENGSVYEDMSETILEHSTVARLLSFPNVMVTSHQAFFTEEALAAISEVTLDNAMSYLKGTPNGNEL